MKQHEQKVNRFCVIPRIVLRSSAMILWLVCVCIVLLLPTIANASTLYLMPQSQTVYQGDTFITEIRVNTEGEEINTVEANLKFPADLLEIIDVSKGGSILTLWAEEPFYSNENGTLSFIGGIPQGFSGEGGLLSITFHVVSRPVPRDYAQVIFREDSKVLLNDGKGTPAKLSFQEGSYEIVEKPEELPQITSKTHPDQNKWYRGTTLSLYWDLVEGAEYSWILSRSPLDKPDEIPDKPEPKEGVAFWMGAMEYDLKEEEDGIYYFILRQKLQGKDWSKEVSRFRAMIDTTPPEEFKPQIGQDPTVFEGKYFLSFAAIDKMSGIDHYKVMEVERKIFQITPKKEWKIAESPYSLEDQSLRSKILVKAVDKAGNEKIEEIIPPYKVIWKDIVISLLILIGIIVAWWIIYKILKFTRLRS